MDVCDGARGCLKSEAMAEEPFVYKPFSALVKEGTKKPLKGTSDITKLCLLIVCSDGNQQPLACCDSCKKVLRYHGHKLGMSGLKCHTCSVMKGQILLEFRGTAKVSGL